MAILDTSDPFAPKLLGRIPTGWWPVALAISPDDKFLYSVNAKGIGEDINPATTQADPPSATGVESFEDSNLVFGTVQKVAFDQIKSIETRIDDYNVVKIKSRKDSVVPIGGRQASKKIKYVIFIEQENKSFDSILGESNHLQPFASTKFHHPDGSAFPRPGRATMVFSRNGDGWLCVHSHMSLNRGVPQASHANRPVKAW